MSLGERIKEHRQNCGLSQENLAELIGVSRQAVTKWEADQTTPSTRHLIKLVGIFGIKVDELMDSTDNEYQSSSEQIYYQYKLDEEKGKIKVKNSRKNNIHMALFIGTGYLGIFLIGSIITVGFGKESYLFDWLTRRWLFLIAAIISIIPALFGKHYFSMITFIACPLGLFLGELFGRNPEGEPFGFGHYGWAIWFGTFIFSIILGVFFEITIFKKQNKKIK